MPAKKSTSSAPDNASNPLYTNYQWYACLAVEAFELMKKDSIPVDRIQKVLERLPAERLDRALERVPNPNEIRSLGVIRAALNDNLDRKDVDPKKDLSTVAQFVARALSESFFEKIQATNRVLKTQLGFAYAAIGVATGVATWFAVTAAAPVVVVGGVFAAALAVGIWATGALISKTGRENSWHIKDGLTAFLEGAAKKAAGTVTGFHAVVAVLEGGLRSLISNKKYTRDDQDFNRGINVQGRTVSFLANVGEWIERKGLNFWPLSFVRDQLYLKKDIKDRANGDLQWNIRQLRIAVSEMVGFVKAGDSAKLTDAGVNQQVQDVAKTVAPIAGGIASRATRSQRVLGTVLMGVGMSFGAFTGAFVIPGASVAGLSSAMLQITNTIGFGSWLVSSFGGGLLAAAPVAIYSAYRAFRRLVDW